MPRPRAIPSPPRCRGIPLGDGNYTGCAYGYGDLEPYTGPCDCTTCSGSGLETVPMAILPHSEFGAPDCCGCLMATLSGDQAAIVCNECGAVVRSVAFDDLHETFVEMELTVDLATAMCPHCQFVNLFPGFSKMKAFVCQKCGKSVSVDPFALGE